MHLRRVKVATVVSVFALVGVACASNSSSSSNRWRHLVLSRLVHGRAVHDACTQGTLLVASCLDYAPFENVKNGQPVGFDVEMTDAIAAKIGFTQDRSNGRRRTSTRSSPRWRTTRSTRWPRPPRRRATSAPSVRRP